jgi:hypothetical protein
MLYSIVSNQHKHSPMSYIESATKISAVLYPIDPATNRIQTATNLAPNIRSLTLTSNKICCLHTEQSSCNTLRYIDCYHDISCNLKFHFILRPGFDFFLPFTHSHVKVLIFCLLLLLGRDSVVGIATR